MSTAHRHDCFLAHNTEDKPAVEELARRLAQQGVEPWLDAWNLIPGRPWQPAVEEALATCAACAVFIGPSGLGPWQHAEMQVALTRLFERGDVAVIPVLLPGAERPPRSQLPGFLLVPTWVEFRDTLDDADALHRLVCGVRGVAPGPGPEHAIYRGQCPYRGLESFREQDAPFFFGREPLTDWLLDRLRPARHIARDQRFLALVGASGSGKSSLVRAGLIPALRAGKLPGSATWPIVVMRPGPEPIESLAVALAAHTAFAGLVPDELELMERLRADSQRLHLLVRRALNDAEPESRVVIVVDQFEEAFTLCERSELRDAFFDALLHASTVRGGQTIVVVTLRADFYGKCAIHAQLAAALSEQSELVGPMTGEELRRAIEKPAQLTGTEIEPGLADLLVQGAAGEPGALPLLQHALRALWDQRQGRKLAVAAYRDMGGLEGALDRHAEAVFVRFSSAEQAMCARIMARLVQPGDGTEDTRRRAPRAELGQSAELDRVVAVLADERLITTEGGTDRPEQAWVEISHEALIRGWSRLRAWIESNRQSWKIHHRLAAAAREWYERRGREHGSPRAGSRAGDDYLHRGAHLAEIEEWAAEHGDELNELEREFLARSIELREREQTAREAARRQELERERAHAARLRKRAYWLAGAGALAVTAAVTASLLFVRARAATEREQAASAAVEKVNTHLRAANADARAKLSSIHVLHGVQARDREDDWVKAMHLFASAAELAPARAGEQSWRLAAGALEGMVRLEAILTHDDHVFGAAFSQDGARVLTWSGDKSARLWDASTGAPLTPPMRHDGSVVGAAWSHDHARVLTWSQDGTARVWDASTGAPLAPAMQHDGPVGGATWSQDGARVLTWSEDETVRLWDAWTGKPLAPAMQHGARVWAAQWSQDQARVLTWSQDRTSRIWDAGTARPLVIATLPGANTSEARWSKDAARLLARSRGGGVQVWDARTGKPMTPAMHRGSDAAEGSWSQDEGWVLTWSTDKTARVWDARTGAPLAHPMQHDDIVRGAAWSRDDGRVLTWTVDGVARVWDARTGEPLAAPMRHHGTVQGAAWSQDDTRVLTWSADKTARVWDARTGTPLSSGMRHDGAILGAAWSRDEKRVLTRSSDHTVRVWSVRPEAPRMRAMWHGGAVWGVAWSRDEERLLTWSQDGAARVWDASRGEPVVPAMQHDGAVWGAAWSRDEERVLTWSLDRTVRLWDARKGQPLVPALRHGGAVWGAAWSRDEERVLVWSSDGAVRLWDARTGQPLAPELRHGGKSKAPAWSPDKERVLTWSHDGTSQMWDARTGKPLAPAIHQDEPISGERWSQDGSRVLTFGGGTARVWDARTGEPQTFVMQHSVPPSIDGAEWSRDGSRVLLWSDRARVWDARTGAPLSPVMPHGDSIWGVNWNEDETRLLTRSDRTVRLWDVATGKPLTPAMQHQAPVMGVEWSQDGAYVLSWSQDGTARVWDASTGTPMTPALQHQGAVAGAAWSRDEQRLLTWSDDGTARLWDLSFARTWPRQHLVLRYQVLTGMRLDPTGGRLEVIPAGEWYGLAKRYTAIARSLAASTPDP